MQLSTSAEVCLAATTVMSTCTKQCKQKVYRRAADFVVIFLICIYSVEVSSSWWSHIIQYRGPMCASCLCASVTVSTTCFQSVNRIALALSSSPHLSTGVAPGRLLQLHYHSPAARRSFSLFMRTSLRRTAFETMSRISLCQAVHFKAASLP